MQTQVPERSSHTGAEIKQVVGSVAAVLSFFALIFLIIDWKLAGFSGTRTAFGYISKVLIALSLSAGAWARLKPGMTKYAKIMSALTFAFCVVWLVSLAVMLMRH